MCAKSISYGGDLFGKSWPFVMATSYRWSAGRGGIDFAVLPLESGSEEGVSSECRQIRSLRFPGYLEVIRLVTAKLCRSEIFPVLFEHVSGVLHPLSTSASCFSSLLVLRSGDRSPLSVQHTARALSPSLSALHSCNFPVVSWVVNPR